MDMLGKDMVRTKAKTVINEAAKGAQGVVDNMMGGGQKKPGTGGVGGAAGAGGLLTNLANTAQDAMKGGVKDSTPK
ncbi:hypothetical protein HHUSO_G8565 [Huso huso]|uniref:Uncharacterized protein n=1 Tax=Huso huso TaxID=61971 RepID=A0ABR0ZRF4_HUSHU